TPTVPRCQTPPNQTAITSAIPLDPLVTALIATPIHETRAGRKRPRGLNSDQPLTVPDSEKSPPDLGDTHVDDTDSSTYIEAFMVDGGGSPPSRGHEALGKVG
ncbi:hypothetical protein SO802_012240, partial [Lithocarpus litseifolius]